MISFAALTAVVVAEMASVAGATFAAEVTFAAAATFLAGVTSVYAVKRAAAAPFAVPETVVPVLQTVASLTG